MAWFWVSGSAHTYGTWVERAFRSLRFDASVLWELQENLKHPLHTGMVGRASWNDLELTENQSTSQIILYQTEDCATRAEVRLQNESGWLMLAQMAGLCQRDQPSPVLHVQNIFAKGELSSEATVANSAIVHPRVSVRLPERSITTSCT
jgi:hypothetical protein